MTRRILASVLSLGLMFSGIAAAPARAGGNNGNDEVSRLIAGAIALFILGKAVEQASRKNAPRRPAVQVSRAPQRPGVALPPVFRGRVPNECRFTVGDPFGRNGRRAVYGKLCLDEVMYRPDRLPPQCLERVRVRHGGMAVVYGATCLQQNGFRDSRWRG